MRRICLSEAHASIILLPTVIHNAVVIVATHADHAINFLVIITNRYLIFIGFLNNHNHKIGV